jgi:Family of unknown function (DUF6494)
MFIQPHVATQDDVSLLLDDAIGKGFAVIGINEDPTILMIVAVSKGAHAEQSILGDSFPAAGNGGIQAFSPPVAALQAPVLVSYLVALKEEIIMDEDHFNMAVRKFLKEVGVTSQREIERIVREGAIKGTSLRLRMTLTSDDEPALKHVVETTVELR